MEIVHKYVLQPFVSDHVFRKFYFCAGVKEKDECTFRLVYLIFDTNGRFRLLTAILIDSYFPGFEAAWTAVQLRTFRRSLLPPSLV